MADQQAGPYRVGRYMLDSLHLEDLLNGIHAKGLTVVSVSWSGEGVHPNTHWWTVVTRYPDTAM